LLNPVLELKPSACPGHYCAGVERRHPLASGILILSASMGAGHDGAAAEIARRASDAGYRAEVRDFLEAGPFRIGDAFWYRARWLCPALSRFVTLLARRRVLRWQSASKPAVVVSTYPLATLCLGQLRGSGLLPSPVVNYITDFAVHPLWTHPSVDLNLTVHQSAAAAATASSGRPSIACGPAVAPAFGVPSRAVRAAARRALLLPADQPAVLVAAGSWGVGDVFEAWQAVLEAGCVPVIACGTDRTLLVRARQLAAARNGPCVVLPWTDRMAEVMAACDALVDNAGGLTSMEAMKSGLPVIAFRPIAGHGKENCARMSEAGVVYFAHDRAGLVGALCSLRATNRRWDAQVKNARSMFRSDPFCEIDRMARAHLEALTDGLASGPITGAVGATHR
jgi:processive 1,2-diacylglycerol beta-glucosyltransferase